ncbi:MAG: hypothetical protein ACREXP_02485, partial [Steroidobacteraceae bacterium]
PIQSKDSAVAWVNNNLNLTNFALRGYTAARNWRGAAATPANIRARLTPLDVSKAVVNGLVVRPAATLVRPAVSGIQKGFGAVGRVAKPPLNALNRGLNPYAMRGIEPGLARGFLQNAGYGARYGAGKVWQASRSAVTAATVPQLAAGAFDVVHDDNRYLRPWNVATNNWGGRHSLTLDFPITGTRFSAWWGGGYLRLPYWGPLDTPINDADNGSMPVARVGAPPTDPTGNKQLRLITIYRAMLADAGIGVRWFGNKDFYPTSSATTYFGSVGFTGSADVPIEKGKGKNALSILGNATSWWPQVRQGWFAGPVGAAVSTRQTTPAGNVSTQPFSRAARDEAVISGDRYVIGTAKSSPTVGDFYTLNPSFGRDDPSDARRAEMLHRLETSFKEWFGLAH